MMTDFEWNDTNLEWDDTTNTLKGTIGDDLFGGMSAAIIATKIVLLDELGTEEAARITPIIVNKCEEIALALMMGERWAFDNRKEPCA